MKYYFSSIGIETEFVSPNNILRNTSYSPKKDDIVSDIVKAYVNFGLPVIVLLNLWKTGSNHLKQPADDYHAGVISGYRFEKNNVTELYIHDDKIGPFHKVEPEDNFLQWITDLKKQGYSKIVVDKLLIPIYPKIRLKFSYIYQSYLGSKRSWEKLGDADNVFDTELLLFESKKYKESLSSKKFTYIIDVGDKETEKENDKFAFLTHSLPRYLWVIRRKINEKYYQDAIFDATLVYPEVSIIEYDNS